MARSIGMNIDTPSPIYRAVILYRYPGAHTFDDKVYHTLAEDYHYHRAEAYGPYGTRGPAAAQITAAIRHHEARIKNGTYTTKFTYNAAKRGYDEEPSGHGVPILIAFVEEQIPGWVTVAGTTRTL